MAHGYGKLNNFSETLSSLCHFFFLQTNFAHPPSLSVGTTAAFPPTGCVTAPMTVVMVLMRTRNAVCDILLAPASVEVLFSNAQFLRFPDVI